MSDIPGFTPAERRAVEAAMIYRYGQLVELQEAEVEVRLTEWDLQWVDFGDPVHDSDMDDQSDSSIYRGSAGFSPGLHTVTLAGSSGDCEIEISYYVIAVQN